MFTDSELVMAGMFANQRNRILAVSDQNYNELMKANQTILELKQALIVERAHSAGLLAGVNALRPLAVDHALNKPTGRQLPDGRPETQLSLIYDKAFDEKAKSLGVSFPENLREKAK